MKRGCGAMLVSGFVLAALAGYATEPVGRLPQQESAPLPQLEAARTRADHEAIAAWYEREAASAEGRAAAHRRMRDAYALPDPRYSNAAFVEHCENLILRYQQTAESNLALADLHRRLAGEAGQ
ncbi:MAG: hypothetical protein WAO95_03255 [Burkholderiales bacterium]